ncbi:DUF126 domain-containing protein [Candidatus Micrarchaeota archaeon]|nr:DUF126 domain-containing protein [Candidatus Micrarchaeota archaeon]
MEELKARKIAKGFAEGEVLRSEQAISFFGGVNADNGVVVEKDHPLEGKSISGKILVFPNCKGSTVGSYVLYQLKKKGIAPKAMIAKETDAIVAVGAIISEIPMVDHVEGGGYDRLKDGMKVKVEADEGKIVLL